MKYIKIIPILLVFIILLSGNLYSTKLKDVTNIVGVRANHLIGYGLVVGLKGTGDGQSSTFTLQSLSNLLKGVNVKIERNDIKSKNIAAVMITAELPPFSRQGDKIDIDVASIGDAKSINGGILLMTPLKGVDGRIYALAQGQLSIGSQNIKDSTSGTMPKGGVVEREITNYDIYQKDTAKLSLKEPGFSNVVNMQNTINKIFSSKIAVAIDSGTLELKKPDNMSMIEFLATLQNINIDYQRDNKIIIDERSGTVVAGAEIEIEPVVVTSGGITIKVDSEFSIPNEAGNNTEPMYPDEGKPTVSNVVRALSKLGADTKTIITILEAMKRAGAINVELKVI